MLVFKIPEKQKTASPSASMPWIIENIEAQFDDALCHLTGDCVIYGGALRDSLAGIALEGDLDIAIPYRNYKTVRDNFSHSARWVSVPFKKKGDYDRPSEKVINNVSVYRDKDDREVQLIQAKLEAMEGYPCDAGVWKLVKRVDIRSSGILMTGIGDIYEVLPGAMEDCKKKRLVYNEDLPVDEVFKKVIEGRVNKLIKRGWVNEIDLARFTKEK